MAMSVGAGNADDPIMDLNTTPLIDVMLVLLVMFIITIPIQTHAVKIDLPVNDPNNKNQPLIDPIKNKVTIDVGGTVFWNGSPVDLVTLRSYLDQTAVMAPEPELHLQPAPNARYDKVDEVLAVIKKANVTKMGFVGNEFYGNF